MKMMSRTAIWTFHQNRKEGNEKFPGMADSDWEKRKGGKSPEWKKRRVDRKCIFMKKGRRKVDQKCKLASSGRKVDQKCKLVSLGKKGKRKREKCKYDVTI